MSPQPRAKSAALNRRDFIKGAAAAGLSLAAAPLLRSATSMSASAAGEGPRRYVLVGTGSRAGMYLDAIARDFRPHAQLVGLCDSNPGRLQLAVDRVRELGGGEPAACKPDAFEAMLAATKADTVIVTTIDGTHHEYIVRAMNAGCDTVSEKPLTTDPAKCQEIIDARAHTGRACRVTFNLRYSPSCTQVKDLLMSGEIGDILSVDFHWMLDTRHGAEYFRRWHGTKACSGGLMIHKACHHFDLINWWLGSMPASVFATGKREFYIPKTARRMGLSGPHERCLTCPESARCGLHIDLRKDATLKSLYLDQEKHDGYFRDRCVFRPEIDIEDTMNVLVRYQTGATLAYSLNAFNAWEGYTVAFNGTKGRLEYEIGGPDNADRPGRTRLVVIPIRGTARPIKPWSGTGAHQGGDRVMLEDLFMPGRPEDKYLRAADERAGSAAILIGMAANRCFTTGQPVEVASLVRNLRSPDFAPMPTNDDPLPMIPHR